MHFSQYCCFSFGKYVRVVLFVETGLGRAKMVYISFTIIFAATVKIFVTEANQKNENVGPTYSGHSFKVTI